MRFLIVGLGSMGKRRIRCLKRLGYNDILGFDLKNDRKSEAEDKYGIKCIDNIDSLNFNELVAIITSTPPDEHNEYIKLAIEKKKPVFVEASVILEGLEKLNVLAKEKNVFVAPSCTMKFHPAIKDIKNIVMSGKYGKVINFSYHSGQYLRDWHPWEDVKDFYVGKKETGGARELVVFELTWIVDVIGFPGDIACFFGKTIDLSVNIDDTYVLSIDFSNGYGNMTIDVVSKHATRSLILNMEYGQIVWRWDENVVKLYDGLNQRCIYYYCPQGQTAEGYNRNIIEHMYVDELKSFINAVIGKGEFPNSLDEDIKVLKLLEKVENRHGRE